MRSIVSDADVAEGLAALLRLDPQLQAAAEATGPLPLRLRPAGFEGLAAIVTAQQISDRAAASIWARLQGAVTPFTPQSLLGTHDDALRAAGLSRAKIRTLRAVAAAVAHDLDLARLADIPADDAIAALTALPGIGPWTAEVYLLFCTGHPDIFPAGDLALQIGAQRALGLESRPDAKGLSILARRWSPWRGIAACLLWASYRAQRDAARQAQA